MWANPSNWVPTWPSSVTTSSSLPLSLLASVPMPVRLTCMSKTRPGNSGIEAERTWPSSITSPVLMSFAAFNTVCGFMWLAAPRSSPAPHLEGQRALSGGGVQDGVCAEAVAPTISVASKATGSACDLMAILPSRHYKPSELGSESIYAVRWEMDSDPNSTHNSCHVHALLFLARPFLAHGRERD